MAKEPEDLVIQNPQTGIGPSPHLGFGDMRNLDIFSRPGVALLNNKLTKKSGATVDALVLWMVKDPSTPANVYALDTNGVVYKSTDSGATWSQLSDRAGSGQGLAIWKGHLFVAKDSALDVYDISGDSWTTDFKTIDTDSDWHSMIVSNNDGMLYGGAGRYIFSLEEESGQTFDPTTAATYAWTQQALDLPPNYKVKCLEELGNNLMIGTWQGSNVDDLRVADIFPWNRSDPSFGQPIVLKENGVHAVKNINQVLYVLAGIEGKIFASNGAQASVIAQIPQSIADLSGGKKITPYPGAIENFKGRPFFGISSNVAGMGVWSLSQTSRGTILNYEHEISQGEDGSNDVVNIGSLLSISNDEVLVGWQDDNGSAFGIDKTDNSNYTTSYAGYLESPLYRVGTNLNKRTFGQLEFQLVKELASNEGIKVKYRNNLNDSFTAIGTYDYSTLGAVLSHQAVADIPACEFVQIRIEITGTTTTSFWRTLTLK